MTPMERIARHTRLRPGSEDDYSGSGIGLVRELL